MSKISERRKHVGLIQGYCNICGTYGRLSNDHVPPKCAVKLTKMLQKTVSEIFTNSEPVRPIEAKGGTSFRTICSECNTKKISRHDDEIGNVAKEFKLKIENYLRGGYFNSFIDVGVNGVGYTKAMIGHLLAATTQLDCQEPIVDSEFYTPLRNYVLNQDFDISLTHDIYYWFYPFRMNITAQSVAFYNEGGISTVSVLHFFPIAFMVTLKGQGIVPKHATKFDFSKKSLTFNMTTENLDYASFPFVQLKGNQMSLFSSGHTCVSYAAKN